MLENRVGAWVGPMSCIQSPLMYCKREVLLASKCALEYIKKRTYNAHVIKNLHCGFIF